MIVVAGEALYDVFPQMGDALESNIALDAVTGGSPFNVACALGRWGLKPAFFGGIAQGQLGDRQRDILRAAGVREDALVRKPNLVPLMVIALAPDGQPTYSYYGQSTADVDIGTDDLKAIPEAPSLLHLGSYSLVLPPIADTLERLVADLPETSLLTLDPNARPMVEPDVEAWRSRLAPLYKRADIIKLSDEDVAFLQPESTPEAYAKSLGSLSDAPVFLTRGHEGVTIFFKGETRDVTAPKVEVVDTVGAGDSFQSTLISWATKANNPQKLRDRSVSIDALEAIAQSAVAVAARVCAQQGPVMPELDVLATKLSPSLFERFAHVDEF